MKKQKIITLLGVVTLTGQAGISPVVGATTVANNTVHLSDGDKNEELKPEGEKQQFEMTNSDGVMNTKESSTVPSNPSVLQPVPNSTEGKTGNKEAQNAETSATTKTTKVTYWPRLGHALLEPPQEDSQGHLTLHFVGGTITDSKDWSEIDKSKVIKIIFEGSIDAGTSLEGLFQGMTELQEVDGLDKLDMSRVTSTSSMFADVKQLQQLPTFPSTPVLTNVSYMFQNFDIQSKGLLTNFDTSTANDFSHMFEGANLNGDDSIQRISTRNGTNMNSMFRGATELNSNKMLSDGTVHSFLNFTTDKVTNMAYMFDGVTLSSENKGELSFNIWDTSNVTQIDYMFRNISNLKTLNISGFKTSNLGATFNIFSGDSFNRITLGSQTILGNLGPLPTPPTNGSYTGKWQEIGTGTVTNPKGISGTVSDFHAINYATPGTFVWQPVPAVAPSVDHVLGGVNFSFDSVSGELILLGGAISNPIDWASIDKTLVKKITIDSTLTVNNGLLLGAFGGFPELTNIDGLEHIDVSGVSMMGLLFSQNPKLENLDLSSWDMSAVTDMTDMLAGTTNIKELVLGEKNKLNSTIGLSDIPDDAIYSGKWRDIGSGSVDDPKGTHILSSSDLSSTYDGATMSGRYVRQTDTNAAADARIFGNVTYDFDETSETITLTGGTITNPLDWSGIDKTKIKKLLINGRISTSASISLAKMFSAMPELEVFNGAQYLDTSQVTSFQAMFSGDSKLTNLDLSSWKTSNVISASLMFKDCLALTDLNLSGFDFTQIGPNNYSGIFSGAPLESLNLSGAILPNYITYLGKASPGFWMLENTLTDLDLSGADWSKVTTLEGMFSVSSGVAFENLDAINLSNGKNTNKIRSMKNTFHFSNATSINMANFFPNGSVVTDFTSTFDNMKNIENLDLTGFDTSSAETMYSMFYAYSGDSLDVSNFDVSNVIDFTRMFYLVSLNSDLKLGNWRTSNAETMNNMFYSLRLKDGGTLDLSTWDFSNLTDHAGMFQASKIENLIFKNSILPSDIATLGDNSNTWGINGQNAIENDFLNSIDFSGADWSNVLNLNDMFSNALSDVESIDLSNAKNTKNIVSMVEMFATSGAKNIDFTNFDASYVTDFSRLFSDMPYLDNLVIDGFKTGPAALSMKGMFNSLQHNQKTPLNFSGFDTSHVTDFGNMFYATKISSLDISNFDFSASKDLSQMFYASQVEQLDFNAKSGSMPSLETCSEIFRGASALKDLSFSQGFRLLNDGVGIGLPGVKVNGNVGIWQEIDSGTSEAPNGTKHGESSEFMDEVTASSGLSHPILHAVWAEKAFDNTDPNSPNPPNPEEWINVELPIELDFHSTESSNHQKIEGNIAHVRNLSGRPIRISTVSFTDASGASAKLDGIKSLYLDSGIGYKPDLVPLHPDFLVNLGTINPDGQEGPFNEPAETTLQIKGEVDPSNQSYKESKYILELKITPMEKNGQDFP